VVQSSGLSSLGQQVKIIFTEAALF